MFRVAVCDDEKHVLKEVASRLTTAFEAQCCPVELSVFNDAKALLDAHERQPFDALFLDIGLEDADGIVLADKLRSESEDFCIVYISSMEERVFESFATSPLRFVRKDHLDEELDEAVAAVLKWKQRHRREKLVVSVQGKLLSLPIESIYYVESLGKRQYIYSQSGTHEIRNTLHELEEKLLPMGFLKPHKGYLVNYRFVEAIESNSISLKGGISIPVSKYRLTALRQEYLSLVTRNMDL